MKRFVGWLRGLRPSVSKPDTTSEPDVTADPTPIPISRRTRTALILVALVLLGLVVFYVPSVLSTVSELHVWQAVPSSHYDSPPERGSKDAGREAPNEQARRIEEEGGKIARAHIREGRTVLVLSGRPEDDPGAGR